MTDTQHVQTRERQDDDGTKRSARYQRWVAHTSRLLDILAIVFLVDFLAGRLIPDGPSWWHPALDFISVAIWAAFAIDYAVRFSLSVHRWIFVVNHKLDLVMVALPMLRMLRVVLLLRKSFRSISTERIASSLISIVIGIVVVGAFLEWRVEYNAPGANITTFGTALWWSIVTTTTVGYGDTYPVTTAGRFIGSVIMVVGIGLIGTVSATVAAWFVSHKQRTQDDAKQAKAQLDRANAEKQAAQVAAHPVSGHQPTGEIGAAGVITTPTLASDNQSMARTIAALTAQIELLTRQQANLQSTIEALADQRAG